MDRSGPLRPSLYVHEKSNYGTKSIRWLLRIGCKLEVEPSVFRGFGFEIASEGAGSGTRELGDALVARIILACDERIDVADFKLDAGAVAILFLRSAAVNASRALKIAEGFTEGFVTATQNPVDDFAFAHDIEIIHREIAAEFHRFNDIGDELKRGAGAVVVVVSEEGEGRIGEFFGDFEVAEAKFVDAVFVMKNSNIVGETADLVERPSVVEEVTIAKSIFKTIDGKTRDFVVDDGVNFTIGNFASEDAVFFQLAHNAAGVADDFASAFFDGFLFFAIAVHNVNAVFEGGGGNIVEEGGESGFFVMSKAPSE